MTPAIFSNIAKDYVSEARIHHHLIDLKNLDVSAMAEELKKFKKSNKYWLFGPSSIKTTDRTASCSGLAYALLKAGAIGKLVPPALTIRDMILATPNNLSHLVVLAKEKEEDLLSHRKNENASKSFKPK